MMWSEPHVVRMLTLHNCEVFTVHYLMPVWQLTSAGLRCGVLVW